MIKVISPRELSNVFILLLYKGVIHLIVVKNEKLGFNLLVELRKLVLDTLDVFLDNSISVDVRASSYHKLIPFPKTTLKASDYGRGSKLNSKNLFLVDLVAIRILASLNKKDFHALIKLLVDYIALGKSTQLEMMQNLSDECCIVIILEGVERIRYTCLKLLLLTLHIQLILLLLFLLNLLLDQICCTGDFDFLLESYRISDSSLNFIVV